MVNDADDEEQWQFANIAMRELDGIVPYGVLPGNHDQPSVLYNETFGSPRFSGMDWYAGHFGETNDNNYQLISVEEEDSCSCICSMRRLRR